MFLQFGPWRPDLSDIDTGATEATNVVPGMGGYEPQPSLQAHYNGIVSRCQGAIMVVDQFGGTYWFAGDRNHLYLINTITNDWTDVSRPVFRAAPPVPDGIDVNIEFGSVLALVPHSHESEFTFSEISLSGTFVATVPAIVSPTFGSVPVVIPHSVVETIAISTLSTPPPIPGYQPADPDLIPSGRAVLDYMNSLSTNSTKKILSGQYHLDHCQTIFNETGYWPAMCSEHVSAGTADTTTPWPRDGGGTYRQYLKTYWDAGGIPVFHGTYSNPKTHGTQKDSNFTASDMVSVITEDGNAINADFRLLMDNAIAHMLWLQNYGIPVLYRPFYEQVQGGFWYGTRDSDLAAAAVRYKNLWKYHFNYFLSKGVHNAIWVYAGARFVGSGHPPGMSGDFYPGDAWVDIGGVDMYKDLSGTNQWLDSDMVESRAVRNAGPSKISAWTEYGQQSSSSPGLHTDYRKLLTGVKNLFPYTRYWMSWSSVWSMRAADNAYVPETLSDPWVVNRGDLPSFTGITTMEPIRAFYMVSFGNNETVGAPALARLDALPSGTTHAILTCHLRTPSATSNSVSRGPISEDPANLPDWFAAVRARGKEPALAIILHINDFEWAGNWTPTNPATALANYYTAVQPWVQEAEAAGLPFVILCDEWENLFINQNAVTAFQTLFTAARTDYKGQIALNVSHLTEGDILLSITALTDFMGVNAYVPITTINRPTVDAMVDNLVGPSTVPSVQAVIGSTPYMTHVMNRSKAWGKPFILTVGYKSTVGAGIEPSEQPETTVDQTIQRDCWRAFKEAAAQVPDIGLACWLWWCGTIDDDNGTGFTPQGKLTASEMWATDMFKNPYSADSAHHRPIGTGATYAADNHPAVVDWLKSNFGNLNVGLPWGRYVTQNDSSMTMYTITTHPGGSGQGLPVSMRLPVFFAEGPLNGNYYDNPVVVYNKAGDDKVYTFYEFVWETGQQPQANYVMSHDIKGKGHGATRVSPGATGVSLLLGCGRGFELNDNSHGEITHVMQFMAKSQGTDSVTKNQYVWPATSKDGHCDGVNNCVGNIPYGSLWALPQDVYTDAYIENNMGLSTLGKRVARQLRNYGGYLVDGANGRPSRADQTVTEATRLAFNAQMDLIYPHLRMITNNLESQSCAGGGTPIAINSAYDAVN